MADIKLKDIGGEEKTYSGVKHIKMPSSTGEQVEFDLEPKLQERETLIVKNGTQEITPETGYDGMSKVTLYANVQPNLQVKDLVYEPIAFQEENNNTYLLFPVGADGTTQPSISPDEGYVGLEGVKFKVKCNVTESIQLYRDEEIYIEDPGLQERLYDYELKDNTAIGAMPKGTISIKIAAKSVELGHRYVLIEEKPNNGAGLHFQLPNDVTSGIFINPFSLSIYPKYPDVAMTYEYWQPNMVSYAFKGYTRPDESYEGTPGDPTSTVGTRKLSEWFVVEQPDKISFTGKAKTDGTISIALKCYKGTAEITPYFSNMNTISAMMDENGDAIINWGSMAPLPAEWNTKVKGFVDKNGNVIFTEIHFYYHAPTLCTNWGVTPSSDEKPLV